MVHCILTFFKDVERRILKRQGFWFRFIIMDMNLVLFSLESFNLVSYLVSGTQKHSEALFQPIITKLAVFWKRHTLEERTQPSESIYH